MFTKKQASIFPKNALGVIALFVSLIEVFATVSLKITAGSKPQNMIIVWFIIGFPILVLLLFFITLWVKREVLWGPGDFKDQDDFFKLLKGFKKEHDEKAKFTQEQLYRLERKLTELETSERANEYVRQGDFFLNQADSKRKSDFRKNEREELLRKAQVFYDKALNEDHRNERAHIGKAKCLRRKDLFKKSIDLLTALLEEKNVDSERALYNRACYKQKSGSYKPVDVVSDLEQAIARFPPYREYARDDNDFEELRDVKIFNDLVQKQKSIMSRIFPRKRGKTSSNLNE